VEIQESQYKDHKYAQESMQKAKNFLLMLLQIQVQVLQTINPNGGTWATHKILQGKTLVSPQLNLLVAKS